MQMHPALLSELNFMTCLPCKYESNRVCCETTEKIASANCLVSSFENDRQLSTCNLDEQFRMTQLSGDQAFP